MSGMNASEMSSALGVGSVLGKCEIKRELGRGGMGTVYIAHHRTLDMPVAVKVLTSASGSDRRAAVERFLREARLAARIRHQNLVEVMDTDTDPATGASYMIMELVDGASIAALIARGPIEPVHAAHIALGVACALDAAHQQNVIHRDVKPANVLLDVKGVVKLVDLGLAKDVTFEGQLTGSMATLGTPMYMSPEQLRNASNLDIRSDIYSLGATLYEMLTGVLPYRGASFFEVAEQIAHAPVPDPRLLRSLVDPALAEITMRMMAKDPLQRPQTPGEVAQALSSYLSLPGVANPSGSNLRLSGLMRGGLAAGLAGESAGGNTPTLYPMDATHRPSHQEPTQAPAHGGAPAFAPSGALASGGAQAASSGALVAAPPSTGASTTPARVIAAVAVVLLAVVLYRDVSGRPIGAGMGWRAGGNHVPPPPPWWKAEWGTPPLIRPGLTYGPPPEWAFTPGGRPPQGWVPRVEYDQPWGPHDGPAHGPPDGPPSGPPDGPPSGPNLPPRK